MTPRLSSSERRITSQCSIHRVGTGDVPCGTEQFGITINKNQLTLDEAENIERRTENLGAHSGV